MFVFFYRQSFFEAGIERIVDQVVNPKLNTNFVPKIEEVAYKLLGVEKPTKNVKLKLEIETNAVLPIYELEQVSPESEKSQCIPVKDHQTIGEYDEKNEDLESPAFEPIEPTSFESNDDMDISDDDTAIDIDNRQNNGDEVKSNLSSISGLTSNDSNNSSNSNLRESGENNDINIRKEDNILIASSTENHLAPKITIDSAEKLPFSENIISNTSHLIIDNNNQDSVLSQVSSTSRLSIVTYNTRDGETDISVPETYHEICQNICPFGISEEAQMQKFNENSLSNNSLVVDTDNMPMNVLNTEKQILITSFKGKFYDKHYVDFNKKDINESADSKCKSDFGIERVPSSARSMQNVSHRKEHSIRERSSKKGDHPSHKRTISRQRSNSKDSNQDSKEPGHLTNPNELIDTNNTLNVKEQISTTDSSPVDNQIFSGKEIDLTIFDGEGRNDRVLPSIKQTLGKQSSQNVHPKITANMIETKRLTKFQKRIESGNRKSLGKFVSEFDDC